MSIIYSYPEETSLLGSDMLIGTSTTLIGGKQKNITKNFTLDELSAFMSGGSGIIDPVASDFQIAVFNQAGKKLTGSIMSQNVFPNGTGITISGNLTVPGTVTLGGGTNLITLASTTKLGGAIQDFSGATGALNQILIANASGGLSWSNFTSGLTYLGLWDALNNDPGLTSSVGANSTFYIVNAAGTIPLNGNTNWEVGDWAIFVGTTGAGGVWQKIDNTSSITGSGTFNKIPLWSSTFQLTDSLMSQDAGATTLTIAGALTSTGNIIGSDISGVNITGTGNLSGTDLLLTGKISLSTDYGDPGQVLTSGGSTGNSVWATPTTGTVIGSGTTNRLPIWSDGGAKTLGDSILDQVAAGGEFTDTYLSILGTGGLSTQGLEINKFLLDGAGLKGASGQILSSTGTEVRWVTDSGGGVTYTLDAGAQDAASVPLNLTDSANVTTSVKLTGGTDIDVIRTSGTEITINNTATDTNTTYDFGSSTDGANVLLNLVGTPADNSSVTLIGSGVTIAQSADEVTFTVPAGDTYDLNAGTKSGTSVPLNLTSGSDTDNSIVNLTEGTGITLTRDSATEITISGTAQGVTGSGTVNKLPKFGTTTSLTDSIVEQGGGATTIVPLNNGPAINASINFSSQSSSFSIIDYATRNTVTGPAPQVGDVFNFVLTSNLTWTVGGAFIPAGTYPFTITFVGSGSLSCNFNSYSTPSGASGTGYNNLLGNGSSTSINTVDTLSIDGELSMVNNKIVNVAQPTDAQDAATKQYVDDSVVGGLIYQGGYNASTDTPVLDSGGTQIAVSKGWTYTVTADGTFYTETVKIGDVLIAEVDIAAGTGALTDWTTVQSNIDVATETIQGIANFPTGNNQLNIATGSVTAKTFGDGNLGTSATGGYVPDATSAVAGTFLKEDGTWSVAGTGTVTGTGTQYKVPLWSGTTALGNSLLTQDPSATKVTLDGLLEVLGDGTSQDGRIKLNCYLNTHAVTIQSPPHAFTPASYTLILPTVPGSANQVLTSNGFNSNQLFWSTPKLGTVTNFTTVSTAISGITTAVTNPTTTPELTLSITGSPTAALFLDGTGNWSSPGGGVSSVTFNSTLAASTGDALSITPTTGAVVINAKTFDGANKPGVITAASGDAANFLRGDGTWASPSGASATITSNQTTTINATTTVFALGATPNGSSVNFVDAFIDGVYQETTTYSVSGQNLTFNSPIPSGVTVETKTTADYNVGAVVTTASLGQTNTTGNVNLRIIPNYIISNITAQANNLYIFDSTTQAYTLTLPSSPQPGDSIKISIRGGLATNTLAVPATENIMGGVLGTSLVINNATAAFEIIYSGDSTKQGWVIIGNV